MANYNDTGPRLDAGFLDDYTLPSQTAPAEPAYTGRPTISAKGIKFSKFVVTYCIIAVTMMTVAVMYYNWLGIMVQPEIIIGFITGFAVQLITVAWVTAVKEKCNAGKK